MKLEASTAVVTGGASGMGAAAVHLFAEQGAGVVVLDLPDSGGEALAAELGRRARFVAVDISIPQQVEAAFLAVAKQLGRLDVCVNCAAIGPTRPTIGVDGDLFPLDVFQQVMAINVTGLFDVSRHAARLMTRNAPGLDGERGLILNVASVAAFDGQSGQAAYAASKGAVVSLARPMARDLGVHGIRVMTVCPGPIETPRIAKHPQAFKDALGQAAIFPRRVGRPDEFAAIVRAIMENPLLNASTIRLDGGYTAVPSGSIRPGSI